MLKRASLFLLVSVAAVFGLLSAANAAPATKEYQIKAAMMYKFIDFINWPHSFKEKKNFIMCFAGSDEFADSLNPLKLKFAKKLPIKIRRGVTNEDISGCDMVFVGLTSDIRVQQIIRISEGKPILTLGENDNFAEKGGIIGMYSQNNKVRFKINTEATEKSNFTISSDLLGLAKIVR